MLDKRMPKDTLYLIFEEDFRWDNTYDAEAERTQLCLHIDKSAYGARESDPPLIATSTAANQKLKGKYYEIPTKLPASAHEPAAMSRYLTDTVKLATHAHRFAH